MIVERGIAWAFVLALVGAAAPQEKKERVPDAAALKEAEQAVRDLHKEEYRRKLPKERVAFAQALLRLAAETKKDPAARYVMLRDAMGIGTEEREPAVVFEAADRLGEAYEGLKAVELKAAAMAKARAGAKTPDDAARLAEFYPRLIEEAGAAHDYAVALAAAEDFDRVARALKNPGLVQRAGESIKEGKELKAEYEKARAAELKLQTAADDPEACAAWGRFLCLFKGSWEPGLALLAKGPPDRGPNVDLSELAWIDLDAKEAKTRYASGEKWCSWSEKAKSPLEKRHTLTRGRQQLNLALADADGLLKGRIEKRLKETESAGPAGVDLLRLIDVKRDVVAGEWRFENGALVCASIMPNARVSVPYAPPDEYDLNVTAEKKEGWSLILNLTQGDARFAVAFDGFPPGGMSGLGLIDGAWIDRNETSRPGVSIPTGKPVTIGVAVRRTGVSVTLNGKAFLNWQGNYNRLTLPPNYQIPDKKALALVAYDGKYVITKFQLTAVSGTGRPLR